jgi:hypothetical protein
MSIEDNLQDWAKSTSMSDPTSREAAALVERAKARKAGFGWRWPVVMVPALMVAALLVLVVRQGLLPTDDVQAPLVAEVLAPVVPEGPAEVWLDEGVQTLGADEIEVASNTQIQVLGDGVRTRLALRKGKVTAQVATRGEGEGFSIETEAYTVSVVGTRFSVQQEPFEVIVEEGVVEVVHALSQAIYRLVAGDRFAGGELIRMVPTLAPALLPSKPAVSLATLSALRKHALAKEYDQARAGLQSRLQAHPKEVGSWILLAQVEAKVGHKEAAVRAWQRVIAMDSGAKAQRARFEAASLLMDKPAEAELLLRAFLSEPGPLVADAKLKLGRTLLAQGRSEEARAALTALVVAHPGTTPARLARELLQSL